jgi:hypothetical protein
MCPFIVLIPLKGDSRDVSAGPSPAHTPPRVDLRHAAGRRLGAAGDGEHETDGRVLVLPLVLGSKLYGFTRSVMDSEQMAVICKGTHTRNETSQEEGSCM